MAASKQRGGTSGRLKVRGGGIKPTHLGRATWLVGMTMISGRQENVAAYACAKQRDLETERGFRGFAHQCFSLHKACSFTS
ncbi:MAG: hypothetical protein DMF04_03090 [Verrucomicrobia bacterium]|nr:MAG: hypothetical protein DMF04_03090 [Verrucomicrobiota bacterium]